MSTVHQPIAIAALENDSYVITGIEDRCLKALRKIAGLRGTAMIELYPSPHESMTADAFLILTDEISQLKRAQANLIAQAELELLGKAEQMAAYYEGPKGYFDWIDLQKSLRNGSQPGSPEGLNQAQQGGDQ